MNGRRFLKISALAAALAATTALTTAEAEAQFVRTSVTHQLARGMGALNRIAEPKKALRRYAIVIGNRDYAHIEDLKNAENDARAVAAFLRENDFTVFDEYDVDKRRFERVLRRALLEFDGNSEVLFYFAGHGMQIGRRNYLLPTDVTLENVHDVPFETVTLDQVLALLASRTRLQLVILDSCRENPFSKIKLATGLDAELYETGSGFSQTTAPINTLLSFSTSPGALALDGEEGGNSPFTQAFVSAAREAPSQSITRILEEVRRRVYARTNGQQVPWESSTLVEPFLFQAKADAAATLTAKPAPPRPAEDVIVTAPVEKPAPEQALPAPQEATVVAMAPTGAIAEAAEQAAPADVEGAPESAAAASAAKIAEATEAASAAVVATVTATDAAAPVDADNAARPTAAAAATPGEAVASAPEPASVQAAAPEPASVQAAAPTQLAALPPAEVVATPEAPPRPASPVFIDLTAAIDREINIGRLIAAEIDPPPGARIRVVRAPDHGALVFADDAAGGVAGTGEGVELASLTYDLLVRERSTAEAAPGQIIDYFDLVLLDADGRTQPLQVSLAAKPDACDVEAGDWLDPDGVGLARYPNELAPEKALAACLAAVERAPDNGRFRYQLGRAYQALRRYEDATNAFTEARALGHVRAWYALGELKASAEIATGGDANVRASDDVLAHFAMGVEQGDAYAMHSLGKQLLRYGRNKSEREEGFELLSRAIEVGHTFAMNELGYYFLAEGTDHYQPERALEYLNASAEREDIYGYNNLGLVYARGLGGVAKDPKQALDWFLKAAEGGHPYAPVNAGRIYYRGDHGGAPDYAEAVRLYDQGLARGDGWGGSNAAWIILNKPVPGLNAIDAAIRAGKSAALRGADPAAGARKLLAGLDRNTLTRATQTLLNEMGADVTVDGLYGGETREAIAALATETDVAPEMSSPTARLITTARLYWRKNPFRVDLY